MGKACEPGLQAPGSPEHRGQGARTEVQSGGRCCRLTGLILTHLPDLWKTDLSISGENPWKAPLPTMLAIPTAPCLGFALQNTGAALLACASFSSQTPTIKRTETCSLASGLPGVTSPLSVTLP